MRIEINNAHFFAREGIQYPSAVAEGRLVAAAQTSVRLPARWQAATASRSA
jgi:hypothetical protein